MPTKTTSVKASVAASTHTHASNELYKLPCDLCTQSNNDSVIRVAYKMAHTLTGCKNTICHYLNFSYSEWIQESHLIQKLKKVQNLAACQLVTTHQKDFTIHFNGLRH